ncbi:hypothetical protein MARPO_0066s0034 [Marchantia polymorpha]|uniref:Uncharacterized protein n=1 Tax=Marchantia polymorpha TaxID=3197 RepID=A0A2R6WQG1_MARPO|nr:hypothetical protein MARPO_0066s0034 [Marchantia polymorpha]|eukprot:PTQ36076.1 hypothetical protein MARPO_0066s0034 [Marchantia polymorpha]
MLGGIESLRDRPISSPAKHSSASIQPVFALSHNPNLLSLKKLAFDALEDPPPRVSTDRTHSEARSQSHSELQTKTKTQSSPKLSKRIGSRGDIIWFICHVWANMHAVHRGIGTGSRAALTFRGLSFGTRSRRNTCQAPRGARKGPFRRNGGGGYVTPGPHRRKRPSPGALGSRRGLGSGGACCVAGWLGLREGNHGRAEETDTKSCMGEGTKGGRGPKDGFRGGRNVEKSSNVGSRGSGGTLG